MSDITTLKDGKLGFIDGKLVYIKITYEFKDFRNMNLQQQKALYESIEEMMQEFNNASSPTLQGYQTTFDNWAWL